MKDPAIEWGFSFVGLDENTIRCMTEFDRDAAGRKVHSDHSRKSVELVAAGSAFIEDT